MKLLIIVIMIALFYPRVQAQAVELPQAKLQQGRFIRIVNQPALPLDSVKLIVTRPGRSQVRDDLR